MISKSALGASPPATRVTENGNPKKQQAKMALSAQKRKAGRKNLLSRVDVLQVGVEPTTFASPKW